MIGMFMAILDTSIVNIAIPTIDNQLGASPDLGEWVATGYNLALGVVVPTSGWLGDRFGLERVQTVALILFVIGSALCGLSSSITVMIAFRLFQAIGGGLLPAVSLTIVYRLVPPEKIGVAMGIFGFGTVFAPAIGPALGGFLVQYSSWRLIYFINIPIGIVGAALSYRLLPRFARAPGRRFDLAGWVTIAVSLFSLLLALSEGEKWHWTSYKVLVLLAVGALSLALFVVIELSTERPLLDLGIFKSFNFTISEDQAVGRRRGRLPHGDLTAAGRCPPVDLGAGYVIGPHTAAFAEMNAAGWTTERLIECIRAANSRSG
jgi:EmrB/QacA subfamily drug resistance transporter